ncbi:MAG: ABC transporter ATP-binding protein, partial [Sediminibacterium sp.]|nr:ABC transporter ATP-binding protein [Sediminibacterium sp.]
MSSSDFHIQLRGIKKSYLFRKKPRLILDNLDFTAKKGEFLCLLGASGSGKSTLVRLIAGLEQPDSGSVLHGGQKVSAPSDKRILVFQDGALFPWLTVEENIAFGLNSKKIPRSEQKEKIDKVLKTVGLEEFRQAYIHQLSGGMKQRVAIARAIVLEPEVLLMDEPFAALDAQTRDQLHLELQDIWRKTGCTIVFVTHNVRESVRLGDRVLLLSSNPGKVVKEYSVSIPHPRYIEDHAVVDLSREILKSLKLVVQASEQSAK